MTTRIFFLTARAASLASVSVLAFLTSGCQRRWTPWLSPAQIEVQGECAIFSGRIVANGWAGRQVETARGARYRTRARFVRLPSTVRLLVVDALQAGPCGDRPSLKEVPGGGQRAHWLPATFALIEPGSPRGKSLPVREEAPNKSPGKPIMPEKKFPWPCWPWTCQARPNIGYHFLDVVIPRPLSGLPQLQVCTAGQCSTMRWPADGH